MREPIKDFYGRVLGWLEDQGDRIIATDFLWPACRRL